MMAPHLQVVSLSVSAEFSHWCVGLGGLSKFTRVQLPPSPGLSVRCDFWPSHVKTQYMVSEIKGLPSHSVPASVVTQLGEMEHETLVLKSNKPVLCSSTL